MRALVSNLSDAPFILIGVNSDQDRSLVQTLEDEGKITWLSFANNLEDSTISDAWEVSGWPSIFLIDGDGVIRFKNVRGSKLNEALAKLLDEVQYDFPEEAIETDTASEAGKTDK
jgi:hypothetical protein